MRFFMTPFVSVHGISRLDYLTFAIQFIHIFTKYIYKSINNPYTI